MPITKTGWEIKGPIFAEATNIFSPEAMQFISDLHHTFNPRRLELLKNRAKKQEELKVGKYPDFSMDTAAIRSGSWAVCAAPKDLADRRVEITGPVEKKMMINALNSGANVFMADFEDSLSPTWRNIVEGQLNLQAAIRRTLSFVSPEGKPYKLNESTATLVVRPRGWHLDEAHVQIQGENISASLFRRLL